VVEAEGVDAARFCKDRLAHDALMHEAERSLGAGDTNLGRDTS
jgi:hypothetical protein